ncbi:restriction endonuclease subunit S [uncultured Duncaniella sp.]|uniref:restriction endonuclease subunit S n=1 Tax=uncultured Duncaniella sp. TaxID=2768039 RepID=UPI0025A9439A|nr:restriction endonuclease subunit S [uncultured Duncaniella sp.]
MKQQYDSYKPSGIDCIGDIPSHWEVFTLKQASTSIRNGYVGPTKDILVEDGIPYIQSLHIKDGRIIFSRGGYYVSPEWGLKHPKIFTNDIVIVQTGDIGQVALVPEEFNECNCHALIIVVCDNRKAYPAYLCYYLRSSIGKELMLLTKTGATLPHLNSGSICNTQIVLPPLAEQEAIAAWLDEKCGEIDAAIAKVDREIELIDELKQSEISRVVTRGLNPDAPLRPSGIDWIGDIPEHWKMCRFKNFMYLKTTPSVSDIKVGLENLESGSGKFIESDTEFEGNGVEFCTNNILYGKLRPYLKKVWLAEFSGNAIGDFFVFSNCPNSNASYLKYVLLSDGFTKQADGSTFGAKMPRVSSEFILTLPFYLPPLAEQQAIADYLDKKCAEIDGLKAKLNRKRETLTELRQSIISEVVTGKRKVI